MIAHSLQEGALNVGADLFTAQYTLIEFGVDPLGIGHFAIVTTTTRHKYPWGTYIVIPTDDAVNRITHHIDVNGSRLFVFAEVQIVHMTGKYGAILEINDIVYPVALLGGVEQWPNAAILWIFLDLVVVYFAQGSHQFYKLHAARFGYAIIEEHIDLSLLGVIQLSGIQLKYLQMIEAHR